MENKKELLPTQVVSRSYAPLFIEVMEFLGFDYNLYYGDRNFFENDIFKLVPYSELYEMRLFDGEDVPDFYDGVHLHYKPKNIKISWYKYPFRSSCSNVKLNYELFKEMMVFIAESMGKTKDELAPILKRHNKRDHIVSIDEDEFIPLNRNKSGNITIGEYEDVNIGDKLLIYELDQEEFMTDREVNAIVVNKFNPIGAEVVVSVRVV